MRLFNFTTLCGVALRSEVTHWGNGWLINTVLVPFENLG